jgi:DNA-binding transcriptional MerR regulator
MRKIIVFKFIKFEKELKNVSIIKNMNTNEEKYLRPEEVSKILQVTTRSLENWNNEGILKCIRTKGNHRRYLMSDVMTIKTEEKYIRPEEVSKMLDVTTRTLENWSNQGILKCVRTVGNHRRYLMSDVMKMYKVPEKPPVTTEYELSGKTIKELKEICRSKSLSGFTLYRTKKSLIVWMLNALNL